MEVVLDRIKALFATRLDYIRDLIEDGAQNEHWFRRRLLNLFGELETEGVIEDFRDECEAEGCPGDIDFILTIRGEEIAIEGKAFLVGEQRSRKRSAKPTAWKAAHYFVPDTIGGDITKLTQWTKGPRFLVAIMYRNPGQEGWDAAVSNARKHFPRVTFEPIGDPAAFPAEFFVGVLRVGGCPSGS